MYNKYFSKGHKCSDNFCSPLSSPIADFNIAAYEEISQERAICFHWHNVKGS